MLRTFSTLFSGKSGDLGGGGVVCLPVFYIKINPDYTNIEEIMEKEKKKMFDIAIIER